MKKNYFLILFLSLLASCAFNKENKKSNDYNTISKITKIEIMYHNDDFVIIDGGGSNITGLGSFLGPIGSIAEATAQIVSKSTVSDRASQRSKEFNNTILNNFPEINCSANFVNEFAKKLRENGKEVKITLIDRPHGEFDDSFKIAPQDGYARIVFRITTGYGAETATSSFNPLIINEYIFIDENNKVLASGNETKKNFGESYFTYQGLLEAHKKAVITLQDGLLSTVDTIYKDAFISSK